MTWNYRSDREGAKEGRGGGIGGGGLVASFLVYPIFLINKWCYDGLTFEPAQIQMLPASLLVGSSVVSVSFDSLWCRQPTRLRSNMIY